ncbi:hypothetical protein TNCV_4657251 [Trichonephila clavipes]|nr:hypothetical protein TNCV_4657251 [Trichonephila clavipes]
MGSTDCRLLNEGVMMVEYKHLTVEIIRIIILSGLNRERDEVSIVVEALDLCLKTSLIIVSWNTTDWRSLVSNDECCFVLEGDDYITHGVKTSC